MIVSLRQRDKQLLKALLKPAVSVGRSVAGSVLMASRIGGAKAVEGAGR